MGLHEDRPEHVHILALARLDVVVEDVDPSLLARHCVHVAPELPERGDDGAEPPHSLIALLGRPLLPPFIPRRQRWRRTRDGRASKTAGGCWWRGAGVGV